MCESGVCEGEAEEEKLAWGNVWGGVQGMGRGGDGLGSCGEGGRGWEDGMTGDAGEERRRVPWGCVGSAGRRGRRTRCPVTAPGTCHRGNTHAHTHAHTHTHTCTQTRTYLLSLHYMYTT